MKIAFFGTRGVSPIGAQMSCGLVEASGGTFAIDLGSTTLFEDIARIAALDHVLLTHMHPDHIAMLASLIIARLNLPDAEGDCIFVSPQSVREYMTFSGLGEVPGYRQPESVPHAWCGLQLEAVLTNHPKPNYAYRMSEEGKSVVWTGDCSYSPELAAFCSGADVVICESSMRDEDIEKAKAWGHMTPSLFAKLMNEAGPKKAVATHFTDLSSQAFSEAVKPQLLPEIDFRVAKDGFVLEV
jgi:ribonuclease BN (tRNA processing enzyme)